MEAEYQRSLTGCYLILREEGGTEQDSWQTRILSASRIDGLLPVTEEHIDNRLQFRYEITSLQPLDVFFGSCRLRAGDLRRFFTGLLETLRQMEDYLLEGEQLLLDPEYLYVSWDSCRLWAPYYPCRRTPVRESLRTLTEYILRKIGAGDREAVILTCRFLHALETEHHQLADLMAELNDRESLPPYIDEETEADAGSGYGSPGEELSCGEWEENGRLFGDAEGLREADAGAAEPADTAEAQHAQKAEQERGGLCAVLPSRETVITALVLIPAAAGIFLLLQLQKSVLLTRTESLAVGGALALGVVLCLLITAAVRRRGVRKAEESDENGGLAVLPHVRRPARTARFSKEELSLLGAEGIDEEELGGFYETERLDEEQWNEREQTVLLSFAEPGTDGSMQLLPADSGQALAPIRLTGESVLVGQKGGPADIGIADPTVSRIHARLFRRNGIWFVTDMSSRNGTAVDGKKAVGREEIPLSDGMSVAFARCKYRVAAC